jgi:hypothetical protein
MIGALREPLTPRRLALATGGVTAAVALYCAAYTALAGRPEGVVQSLAWALINIAPWLLALEAGKRARGVAGVGAAILCGFAGSMLVGLLLAPNSGALPFEAWRRVPALVAAGAVLVALRWGQAYGSRAGGEPLPLLPRQIDWVRAAGNYVELRAGERIIVHRTSISAAERDLAAHGFVRIHRSTLVRRDRIAQVRPVDVVLTDGTHLKLGKRFRSQLSS